MEEVETDRTCSLNRDKKKPVEMLSLKISMRRENNTEIDFIVYKYQQMHN